jgi:hypothetical protein
MTKIAIHVPPHDPSYADRCSAACLSVGEIISPPGEAEYAVFFTDGGWSGSMMWAFLDLGQNVRRETCRFRSLDGPIKVPDQYGAVLKRLKDKGSEWARNLVDMEAHVEQ